MAIKGNITCLTADIIYIGTCQKGDRTCSGNPQYCGETGKTAEKYLWGTGTLLFRPAMTRPTSRWANISERQDTP